MQSNVPTPFGGFNKFSHLNMPGGQWSQEYKFISQNIQNSHYSALRENSRADWATYDQNAIVGRIGQEGFPSRRRYCTQSTSRSTVTANSSSSKSVSTDTPVGVKLSSKEQLKRAFKEYGVSIVAFHVGISMISLGCFYVLISSGVNLVPVLEYLGIGSPAIAEKVATGSTFVVAYAVHKVFAPARITITLGAIPFLIRYLRPKGFQMPKSKNP
ncbi:protein FAM210B, mitochondrial isoform X2 [Drosophila gunungcola]|nr:protein FAM210B, mitochondrial isoform X2 [Drosophila gunungcola]XP_052854716.1 protein FAM210B, mitochondrial isoform X2 [Drosophila gunungcola]XP_052854717.1 protein FAM210B, mitochondrial isoform X2 [Drosophila gunungcola]